MKNRFRLRDYVLWLHPLGFLYIARISRISFDKGLAVILLSEKCLVSVPMENLLSVFEVAEKNKKIAMEMQGKSSERVA